MATVNNPNMDIYSQVTQVPNYAQKQINAGRLKGFTDISPMWRIEKLTEMFGPCGIGWGYEIEKQWTERASDTEIRAFCNIKLWYKWNGEKSEAIPGTGGSSFATKEKNGVYVSDECYKMALTDAISVAAKALGVGADIYMGCERDKYNTEQDMPPAPQTQQPAQQGPKIQEPPTGPDGQYYCTDCGKRIEPRNNRNGQTISPRDLALMAMKGYGCVVCVECGKKRSAARA